MMQGRMFPVYTYLQAAGLSMGDVGKMIKGGQEENDIANRMMSRFFPQYVVITVWSEKQPHIVVFMGIAIKKVDI